MRVVRVAVTSVTVMRIEMAMRAKMVAIGRKRNGRDPGNVLSHRNLRLLFATFVVINCFRIRRPDGRYSDSASTVSTAVLNHYSGYHRRPINRVSVKVLNTIVYFYNFIGG